MAPGWWRRLPNGKAISALGFGCSSLWAKPEFGDDAAAGVLDAAVAGEINHFDTAPSYGAGTGERRLGAFLRERGRDRFAVSTKVGTNLIDGEVARGFDVGAMRRSLEGSLNRLGVEQVDVLYLHGPSRADLTDELWRFLEEARASGKAALTGMESPDLHVFEGFEASPLDVAMIHYNVANTRAARRIAAIAAAGKTVVSGTVLGQATFSAATFLPTSRAALWYLARAAKNDPLFWWRGPRLARRLRATGRDPHDAAIGFVTGNPAITSGLFGTTRPAHARSNALAGHDPLDASTRAALGEMG